MQRQVLGLICFQKQTLSIFFLLFKDRFPNFRNRVLAFKEQNSKLCMLLNRIQEKNMDSYLYIFCAVRWKIEAAMNMPINHSVS